MYNGGSKEDELLIHVTGLEKPKTVKSFGNQMFIVFKSQGNQIGYDKGFTANISFGSRTNCAKLFLQHKICFQSIWGIISILYSCFR